MLYRSTRLITAVTVAIVLTVAASPARAQTNACPADCNDDGLITRDELLGLVNVGLGQAAVSACATGAPGADGMVGPGEIVKGIGTALNGCEHIGDQDALTAAARVAVSTMESLDIVDFGFIGAAAGSAAAAGGGGAACDDAPGTKTVSCTGGAATVFTTVFAHCRESTITRDGTIVQTVAIANGCSGQIPPNANFSLRFSRFTATQEVSGNRNTLSTADLALDVDPSDAPIVRTTLNGSLEVSNSGASTERFTQTFRDFVVTEAVQPDGSALVTENGTMIVDCLGEVEFDTKVPIRLPAGDACPSDGRFEVGLSGSTGATATRQERATAADDFGSHQLTTRFRTLGTSVTVPESGYHELALRAANGQVYQVLQNAGGDPALGTEDVRITSVIGSASADTGGCFQLSKVQEVVAAPPGTAFPLTGVRKSPLIKDGSLPCFNPNGNGGDGTVCIGPDCGASDCTCSDTRCASFTINAGAPLATASTGVPAAMVDRLASGTDLCSGAQGRDTYGFGSAAPTTEAPVCSAAPKSDGFTLPRAPSTFQAIDGSTLIIAYPVSPSSPFDTASAGFAIARNGTVECPGTDRVIAGVNDGNAVPRPNVRFGADGGVGFDFNGDRAIDKVLSSCRTLSLAQCAVPFPPTPTPGPPPACRPFDLGNALPADAGGDTAMNPKNASSGASCGGGGNNAPDVSFAFTPPADGFYTIDTIGSQFDTVLYVRDGDCAGRELACNDDRGDGSGQSELTVSLRKDNPIVIVVDGFAAQSGRFFLHINSGATPPTPTPTAPAGPALPDLTVTQVTSFDAGGQLIVSATIANQGTLDAAAFRVDFLYSKDAVVSPEDVSSGFGCVFAGLGAGQTATCNAPIGAPAFLQPGSYFVIAVADSSQEIDERDETNNARAANSQITIGGTPGSPTRTPTRTPSRRPPVATKTRTATPTATQPLSFTPLFAPGFFAAPARLPNFAAVADVNADGRRDLVTANTATNNVTVLLGQADGSYAMAPGSPYAVGASSPVEVAVGRVNGDDLPDLIVANAGSDNVSVLLGQPGGGFAPAAGSPFPVGGSRPSSLAVADVNNDAKLDVVTANADSNDVSVLLGQGDGFVVADGSPIAVGAAPAAVAVDDFNGDARKDIVTANADSNDVTVLLGLGNGRFEEAGGSSLPVGLSPVAVAVADVNGDGRRDLVTANAGSGNVTLLLGHADGGFVAAAGSPFEAGLFPVSVVAGDFNGDGRIDLATANQAASSVTVLFSQVGGSFSARAFGVGGTAPTSLAADDVNGDGQPDLVTANQGSENVTVLLGRITGGFRLAAGAPYAVGAANPAAVAVEDVDKHGPKDIIVANAESDNVTVLLAQDGGGFVEAAGSPFAVAGQGPTSVAVGDVDGNGTMDIVTGNSFSATVSVLLGQGDGRFAAGGAFGVGVTVPTSVAVADVNGDDRGDVFVATADGNVALLLGQADGSLAAAAGSPFPTGGSNPIDVVVTDVNGDQRLDIVTANADSNNVSVLLGQVGGGFVPAAGSPFATGGSNPTSVAVADVDVNGRMDLVTANAGSDDVSVLLAQVGGGFVAAPGSPFVIGGSNPRSVAVADVNGDRRPDLVAANAGSDTVSVLLAQGNDFAAAAGSPFAVAQAPVSVAVSDATGDGLPEIVAVGRGGVIVLFQQPQ